MSNDYDCKFGTRLCDLVDSTLNFYFRLGIKGRSRFIKNKNLWLLNERSCNCDSLFLSAWHVHNTGSSYERIQTILLLLYEASISLLQSIDTLGLSSIFVAIEKVVSDSSHDHHRFLADVADTLSKVLESYFF